MNLLALQQRVAGELNRFDLLQPLPPDPFPVIPTYIDDRIGFYQKALFSPSNQLDYSITCIPGQSTYPIPRGLQSIVHVRLLLNGMQGTLGSGGVWLPLPRKRYEYILNNDILSPAFQTLPWCYAQYGDTIRIFATPDNAYPLELMCNESPPAPEAPTDENYWTDDGPRGAATLIILSACADICRRVIHDFERADQYQALVTARESPSLQEVSQRLEGPMAVEGYL